MTGTTAVLCRPKTFYLRQVRHCPTCDRKRRFAGFDQFMYGPTMTCLGCGDTWTVDGMLPRPFEPAWRKKAVRRAEDYWARGAGHKAWRDWSREQLRLYLGGTR